MSERQPDPEKTRRNDDEPDVEGHGFQGPVEDESLNPEPDDAPDDGEGLKTR